MVTAIRFPLQESHTANDVWDRDVQEVNQLLAKHGVDAYSIPLFREAMMDVMLGAKETEFVRMEFAKQKLQCIREALEKNSTSSPFPNHP